MANKNNTGIPKVEGISRTWKQKDEDEKVSNYTDEMCGLAEMAREEYEEYSR